MKISFDSIADGQVVREQERALFRRVQESMSDIFLWRPGSLWRAWRFAAAVRLALLILLVLLVMGFVATKMAAAITPKRVLLVYENDGYSPAVLELQRGILVHLRKELGQDLEIYSEQLEATRFPELQAQALSWVRTRYATHAIDVVVYVGSVPTDILPGVPTIYAGFSSFKLANDVSVRDDKITVWFQTDFKKTITAAHHLQPKAKSALVILGGGYEDHILLQEARAQLRESDVSVEYLVGTPVEELLARVAHLPRDTIVFPISYTRDLQGNIYSTRDVVAWLSQVSSAPIYAAADTVIGSGAVGGYVVDFDKAGGIIADVVLQTLNGKKATQIALPSEGTATFIFDWRQMERWGLRERDLPAGSIVQFKTASAWEQYRWRIVGSIVVIMAQSLLIFWLLLTRRKRALAEAGLHDMTGQLLASQDEERRRFARDLHDGTGQHLSAIALAVSQVLSKFPPGYDALRKLLQDSHAASRQALDEVRLVSFALHPPLLDNLGLVAAVRWYLDGLQKRTKLTIDFEAPADTRRLTPDAERAFFRIVQESMGNIQRHSGGGRINVALFYHDRAAILEIEDDGTGMSAAQLEEVESGAAVGVGIAGMRERLRQLGGRLKIYSSANGTKVTATIPIDEERHAAYFASR